MGGLAPEVLLQRLDMMRRGLTDAQIAQAQGIRRQAIYLWRHRYEKAAKGTVAQGATLPEGAPGLDIPVRPCVHDVDYSWKQQAEAAQRELKAVLQDVLRLSRALYEVHEASRKRYHNVLIDLRMGKTLGPPPQATMPLVGRRLPPRQPKPAAQPRPIGLPSSQPGPTERHILDAIQRNGGELPSQDVLAVPGKRAHVLKCVRFLRRRGLIEIVKTGDDAKVLRLVRRAEDPV